MTRGVSTAVDPRADAFQANRDRHARPAGHGRRGAGGGAGRGRRALRHPPPRAGPPAGPGAHRPAARPRIAVPRALAAGRLGHRRPARRRARHRPRRGRGRRVRDQRQRPDRPGRHLDRHHGGQGPAGPGDRPAQPAAADQPHRVRRRRPAPPGRHLRARRGHLPGPDPAVGRRHPDHHPGVRAVDRRRRVRARAERLHGLRAGPGPGVPRRAAAREDGDRRGRRRGGAGRRRHAQPDLGPGRLPGRRRARCAAPRPHDRASARLAEARAGTVTGRRPPTLDAEELLGHRGGRRAGAVRRPRDPVAGGRRIGARRVQAALRHPAGVRLGHDLRIPRRRPGQQRHPLQRGGPEGRPVHPALQPERHPAAVRAEHHRVHGGHAVRAGRHHQARQPAHQRGVELDGAAPHADGRGVLRRRQLRHVRAAPTTPDSCSPGPTTASR